MTGRAWASALILAVAAAAAAVAFGLDLVRSALLGLAAGVATCVPRMLSEYPDRPPWRERSAELRGGSRMDLALDTWRYSSHGAGVDPDRIAEARERVDVSLARRGLDPAEPADRRKIVALLGRETTRLLYPKPRGRQSSGAVTPPASGKAAQRADLPGMRDAR